MNGKRSVGRPRTRRLELYPRILVGINRKVWRFNLELLPPQSSKAGEEKNKSFRALSPHSSHHLRFHCNNCYNENVICSVLSTRIILTFYRNKIANSLHLGVKKKPITGKLSTNSFLIYQEADFIPGCKQATKPLN